MCLRCLFDSIEETVLWTIRRFRLIGPNDRVGIAVSGGKDSLVLMYILGKLRREGKIPRSVYMMAFSIDEGQPYSCIRRSSSMDFIKAMAGELGIEYRLFSLKDILNVTAMEVAQGLWGKGMDTHMCTICGVLRRRAMNIIGKRFGLTKIATGHNLDDEAQTVVLNAMTNDLKRFAWFGVTPSNDIAEEEFIPRIKPLRFVKEEEIAVYAYYHGIPLMTIECPFVHNNPRYMLKFTLARWERDYPNVKYSLVSFGDNVAKLVNQHYRSGGLIRLNKCKYCGFPASKDVCRVCELLRDAGLLDRYISANGGSVSTPSGDGA